MRLAFAAVVLTAACGGGTRQIPSDRGPPPPPKLEKVRPDALREYEAAMRALRLGGPEANETAKSRLQEAARLDKTLWEAWHNLGVIASEDGDDDQAIELFGKALAINRSHTPTRLARAEAHRRAGNKRDARNDFETTIKELADDDPLRPEASARLASVLRDAGDYDDAVTVLRDSLRVSGPSARIYTELGLIYLAQKRYDMVTLVLARARELAEPKDEPVVAAKKDDKDKAGTPAGAPAVAEKKQPPPDPRDAAPVYNALALLALRQGKAQEAFARFDHAASLDPSYIDARFNKASVLLDAGDYERAKDELQAVLKQAPDDYAAQVALGVALRGLKDLKEAERVWEKVVKRSPRRDVSHGDALFNLAILKADFMSDVPEAKRMLEQYMQDAPGSHPKRQAAEEKRKELGL